MKPFEIGLCLTGSVSAGAYTAGVLDFLFEALEAWEQKKAQNRFKYGNDYSKWDVPWHDIVITGLSGASGGGVTCGLILNSIGKQIDPVKIPPPNGTIPANNDFYNIWVNQLGINELTQTADLQGDSIKSLLNGNALPDIANKTLIPSNFGSTIKRNYIAENLKAILTITNLRGIPYWLKTKGTGANNLIYRRNADYVKFELIKNGENSKFPDTVPIPSNPSSGSFVAGLNKLKAACLATCAFPGAFKVQPFNQNERIYKLRDYSENLALLPNQDFEFLCADGGILNTNPFELLHKDLLPPGTEQNPRDGKEVERSIIIVAPLDTDMTPEDNYDIKKDSLIDSMFPLIGAIRNEAVFTNQQINLAFNNSVYSRFIIAPVRYTKDGDNVISPAITGTSVKTFGAFLSRDFREHDYFLGRRNAQQFFKKNFAIPVDEIVLNPIFASLDINNNKEKFKDQIFKDIESGVEYFCILPLCGEAANNLYNPDWPKDKFDEQIIKNGVSNRIGSLIDAFLSGLQLNLFTRFIKFLFLNKLKSAIVDFIMSKIINELKKGQLKSN